MATLTGPGSDGDDVGPGPAPQAPYDRIAELETENAMLRSRPLDYHVRVDAVMGTVMSDNQDAPEEGFPLFTPAQLEYIRAVFDGQAAAIYHDGMRAAIAAKESK